jgi:predicted nucleic acid-binding protein
MLVDTSVWIDHFRSRDAALARRLDQGIVASHPFVIGELACGGLRQGGEILMLLAALPQVPEVLHDEALEFVHRHALSGIGWVDVHLLASARLAGTELWTRDLRLQRVARRLGVAAPD